MHMHTQCVCIQDIAHAHAYMMRAHTHGIAWHDMTRHRYCVYMSLPFMIKGQSGPLFFPLLILLTCGETLVGTGYSVAHSWKEYTEYGCVSFDIISGVYHFVFGTLGYVDHYTTRVAAERGCSVAWLQTEAECQDRRRGCRTMQRRLIHGRKATDGMTGDRRCRDHRSTVTAAL